MADNKSWRKKIGGKTKETTHSKFDLDDNGSVPPTDTAIELIDRRRHGWRKTIAINRPTTPMVPAPHPPATEDVEDTRSVVSETSTPRRESKPKLVRYASMFTTHKGEPADPIFSEPWNIDEVLNQEDPWSFVDPIVIMESIHSHMCRNYMVPIPLQYTSGLFQLFDDYRKLRSQKDVLEAREREAGEYARRAKAQMLETKALYESEIRRLELLIARGKMGMTGLVKARQGTTVDRKRPHRKTVSTDHSLLVGQHLSQEDIDEDIKAMIEQVLLQRPSSPSNKMTALSQQLSGMGPVGPPLGDSPYVKEESALARKVRSELNLAESHNAQVAPLHPGADMLAQMDVPPRVLHEAEPEKPLASDTLEFDAINTLRNLGALIAHRKGLDVAMFVDGIAGLLNTTAITGTSVGKNARNNNVWEAAIERCPDNSADDATPRPRAQSHQDHGEKRRRHFSFEPGDDRRESLETDLGSFDSLSQAASYESSPVSSFISQLSEENSYESDNDRTMSLPSIGTDTPKPSMIPSPVQTVGRVRRENSVSSLQSAFIKNVRDDRRSSLTSIQTAFCSTSSANMSALSKRRSGSSHISRTAKSPVGSKEHQNSFSKPHSAAALAAARTAEARSGKSSQSNTRASTALSSSRKQHAAGQGAIENNDPNNAQQHQ